MGTIKLRRGSGSPAGSLEQYEVAMDVADKTLYTSSDGSDAVIIGNNTEYFLANNTISGLTNEAIPYADIPFFIRVNDAVGVPLTGMELVRDLGSDGAVSGEDNRGVSVEFSVKSDATNTNNAPQNIYVGGLFGKSGSNDGADPHHLGCFAYDDGITSFNRSTIWEATKNGLTINPRIQANDGMNIEDPDAELDDAVVNIKVDQSGYNRAQLMLEDSNGKAFSMIGEMDSNTNRDKFIVTLDPDNVNSPTNQANYAGDYGVYYLKEYGDIENPAIEMNVFGAKDAFKLRIYDDNNGASPNPGPLGYGGYGYKPFEAHCEALSVMIKNSDTTTAEVMKIDNTESLINGRLVTESRTGFQGAANFRRVTTNSTTNPRAGGAFQSNYEDTNGNAVAPTAGAGAATGWMVNNGFLGSLVCDLQTVSVDANNNLDAANSSASFKVKLYTDGASQQTGNDILVLNNESVKAERPIQYPGYDLNAGPLPSNPAAGMMVFNTDTNKMAFYDGSAWADL